MSTLPTLTHSQLVTRLSKGGARIVGIHALTDAKALKTGNPYGTIMKRSRSVCVVGADYGNAVRREGVGRQGAWEADAFTSAPLPSWKVCLVPNRVYQHRTNGTLYLRTQSTVGQRTRQPSKVLNYVAGGKRLSYGDVAAWLPEKRESAKQRAHGLGEGKTVDVREYAFDSIQSIRIDGVTYSLVRD